MDRPIHCFTPSIRHQLLRFPGMTVGSFAQVWVTAYNMKIHIGVDFAQVLHETTPKYAFITLCALTKIFEDVELILYTKLVRWSNRTPKIRILLRRRSIGAVRLLLKRNLIHNIIVIPGTVRRFTVVVGDRGRFSLGFKHQVLDDTDLFFD